MQIVRLKMRNLHSNRGSRALFARGQRMSSPYWSWMGVNNGTRELCQWSKDGVTVQVDFDPARAVRLDPGIATAARSPGLSPRRIGRTMELSEGTVRRVPQGRFGSNWTAPKPRGRHSVNTARSTALPDPSNVTPEIQGIGASRLKAERCQGQMSGIEPAYGGRQARKSIACSCGRWTGTGGAWWVCLFGYPGTPPGRACAVYLYSLSHSS